MKMKLEIEWFPDEWLTINFFLLSSFSYSSSFSLFIYNQLEGKNNVFNIPLYQMCIITEICILNIEYIFGTIFNHLIARKWIISFFLILLLSTKTHSFIMVLNHFQCQLFFDFSLNRSRPIMKWGKWLQRRTTNCFIKLSWNWSI